MIRVRESLRNNAPIIFRGLLPRVEPLFVAITQKTRKMPEIAPLRILSVSLSLSEQDKIGHSNLVRPENYL